MTTTINTNIASQIAQNNLANTQNSLTSAITQLSSGLKINSAADNPAGQAIANLLQSQINGQTTAQSNANQGISLAQTGESALTQITNNLQTIRQLAVQAANGTNSAANRASLNQQVQQAISQINTIASTTSFNGQNLLDGSFGQQNFQIGANAGQTISVNLSQGVKATQIGQTSTTTFSLQGTSGGLSTESLAIGLAGGTPVTIANSVAGTAAGQSSDSAYAAATAINNANISGLTASASNSQTAIYTGVTNGGTSAQNYNLTINGTNVFGSSGLSVSAGTTVSASTVLSAINSQTSTTGVTATLSSDGQTFTLSAADGRDITATQSTSGANIAGGLSNAGQAINSATANGTLQNLTAGAITSSTTGVLQGSVSLASASAISLSGTAASDITSQYANSNNSADSLQGTQTIAATAAFTAAAGSISFSLGGSATATATIATTATSTAASVEASINSNSALQQAGVSAAVNSQGKLVVTNTSGQSLAILDSTGGPTSGLDNAQTITGVGLADAGTVGAALNIAVGAGAPQSIAVTAGETPANIASAINSNSSLKGAGVEASVKAGQLFITNTSGQALTITDTAGTGTAFVSGLAGTAAVGTNSSPAQSTTYTAAASGSLAGLDVLTEADASKAIQTIDAALNQVNALQGQLGSVQDRFTSVISNLTASTQNASSAQSTIEDTNYASATAQLSRAQVLSQAATAIIAQANQLPQQVLKLLQ
jgi:flagellin